MTNDTDITHTEFVGCVAYKDLPTGYILEPCSSGPSVDCSKGWPVPESWGERIGSKEDYIEKLQVRMEGLEDMLDKVAANYVEDALRYRWLIKRSEEIYVVPSTQIGKNLSVDSFGDYNEVKNQVDEEIDNLMAEELQ